MCYNSEPDYSQWLSVPSFSKPIWKSVKLFFQIRKDFSNFRFKYTKTLYRWEWMYFYLFPTLAMLKFFYVLYYYLTCNLICLSFKQVSLKDFPSIGSFLLRKSLLISKNVFLAKQSFQSFSYCSAKHPYSVTSHYFLSNWSWCFWFRCSFGIPLILSIQIEPSYECLRKNTFVSNQKFGSYYFDRNGVMSHRSFLVSFCVLAIQFQNDFL